MWNVRFVFNVHVDEMLDPQKVFQCLAIMRHGPMHYLNMKIIPGHVKFVQKLGRSLERLIVLDLHIVS